MVSKLTNGSSLCSSHGVATVPTGAAIVVSQHSLVVCEPAFMPNQSSQSMLDFHSLLGNNKFSAIAHLFSSNAVSPITSQLQSPQPTGEPGTQESRDVLGRTNWAESVLDNMPTLPGEHSARHDWVGVHSYLFHT